MNTIYLDLDGVLINWTKEVCKITKIEYPKNKILEAYELGKYLPQKVIDEIHWSEEFWTALDPFPWTKKIIDLVDITCSEWRFLTRACSSPYSYSGKALWINNYYPQHNKRLIVCRGSKSFACKPNDILIDDHPKNIKEWNKMGGRGFHWSEMTEDYSYKPQFDNLKQFLLENYNKK